jgi:GTP pyrophosphokinase
MPQKTFQNLKKKINYLSAEEQRDVERAFNFALKAHQGQRRRTGEPYVIHELETAAFVADLKMDAQTITASLLHDVVEDTPTSLAEVQKEFGKTVANLVDGVTKLGRIRITRRWFILKTQEELKSFDRQMETLRKMFVAMARDIRVVIIKLADRLHNMKTIRGVAPEKRLRIAKETLEIYAPLAYRLGMGELKGQLEDLAFPIVYPDEYEWLSQQVKDAFTERTRYLKKVEKYLARRLAEEGIKAEIHGRAKHLYSLWRKLQRYDNDLSRIYDLVALRVIVSSIADCYKVLGIIHENWKPLVGRIKDYIAMPKPNGYQSLHTTVFCLDGRIVEFQIRTQVMHEQAENGIAAGWHYDEAKGTLDYILKKMKRAPYEDIRWVRELAKWQAKSADNRQFQNDIQLDFFSDRIFVYTPRGEVKDLPAGATPIDFAYAIHSEVGNSCVGAKINGKMSSLDTTLHNGDIVEIIKSKRPTGPKRDWLEMAKTSLARSHIRRALRAKAI